MVNAGQARQVVCTNCAEFAPPGWRRIDLPGGWALHAHPDAAVTVLRDDPAAPAIRIGHAFNLDAGPNGGGEDLSGTSGAGRFAVIDWPRILPDAGALLGLHYGARGDRRAVATSPALAAEAIAGAPVAPDVAGPAHPRLPINYIPAPGTPFSGIRRLLHDQALDLEAFAVRHRPSPIRPLASYEAALGVLADELCRFAEALKTRIPGTVYLPLTAGLDSRLIAASFVAAGLPFEAVTLDYVGKPRSDVTVARAIARRLGVRHQTIRLAPPDPGLAARFRAHTAGAFADWDNTHIFPGGGYRYLGRGDAMIVGACFEIGRQTAGGHCFRDVDLATATGAEVWRNRNGGQPAPAALAGFLDEWLAWRRAHPLPMDFAATFYLDQRIGGWRAALEHGYDLLPGLSLCPANNPRIYSAMITPGLEDQVAGRIQREAIGLLAPELVAFPHNPKTLRCHMKVLRRRVRGELLPALAARLHVRPARPVAPAPATMDALPGAH
jgi:hypothetical protein